MRRAAGKNSKSIPSTPATTGNFTPAPSAPGMAQCAPHKLVIVNPSGKKKTKTHIRRVKQKGMAPPYVAADDSYGSAGDSPWGV
jgi:hypothetical protein